MVATEGMDAPTQERESTYGGIRAVDKVTPPIERLKQTRAMLAKHIEEIDALLDQEVKSPGFLELAKSVRKFLN